MSGMSIISVGLGGVSILGVGGVFMGVFNVMTLMISDTVGDPNKVEGLTIFFVDCTGSVSFFVGGFGFFNGP